MTDQHVYTHVPEHNYTTSLNLNRCLDTWLGKYYIIVYDEVMKYVVLFIFISIFIVASNTFK